MLPKHQKGGYGIRPYDVGGYDIICASPFCHGYNSLPPGGRWQAQPDGRSPRLKRMLHSFGAGRRGVDLYGVGGHNIICASPYRYGSNPRLPCVKGAPLYAVRDCEKRLHSFVTGRRGRRPHGVYEYNIVCRRGGFYIRPFDVSGAYGMLPYGVRC